MGLIMKKQHDTLVVNMASESDISVQGHGVHTAYVEMASALEKRSDIKVIRGEYGKLVECDVYHLHTIGMQMWRKIFHKGTPKIVSAHVIPDSFVGSILLAKYWKFIARWYMRWFYNRADKVLAVSGMVAKVLHEELKVPQHKIETFYNTVDMSRYVTTKKDIVTARKERGVAQDTFVVVGVGQVQPRKRIDIFEQLARRYPDILFVWVGGIPFKQAGADYGSMKKLIGNAPKNLIITDVIPHQEVKQYLQAADVFCLPAEQENHPMCVLEAAGVGLPIILRDIPEYDDTFGNNAWRCHDDTFGDAIVALKNSQSTRSKWRQKSKKIATRFDSAAAADRLVKIYHDVVYNKK